MKIRILAITILALSGLVPTLLQKSVGLDISNMSLTKVAIGIWLGPFVCGIATAILYFYKPSNSLSKH